jgi:hypothetical protein
LLPVAAEAAAALLLPTPPVHMAEHSNDFKR